MVVSEELDKSNEGETDRDNAMIVVTLFPCYGVKYGVHV